MKSSKFNSRRPKARIIGQEDDDEDTNMGAASNITTGVATAAEPSSSTPLFMRKSSSNKHRKPSSKVHLSYDDSADAAANSTGTGADADDEDSSSTPVVIKKPGFARQVMERNAVAKALNGSSSSATASQPKHSGGGGGGGGGLSAAAAAARQKPSIPAAATRSLEQLSLASSGGVSYSKEALEELRTSTPTTPRDVGSRQRSPEDAEMADISSAATPNDPLSIASKFGGSSSGSGGGGGVGSGGIPDAATIRALKARRAQRRDNPDYISLTDGVTTSSSTTIKKKKESRLKVIGDEDELFESYVDDGGIALGKKAEAEKERRRREGIRDAIIEGEGEDESSGSEETDSDDEEDDEFGAWESHQIRSGGFGTTVAQGQSLEQKLRKPPSTIAPLPNLADVVGRLEELLARMNQDRQEKAKMVENLAAQREEIERREKEVQEQLRIKGEAYEKLRNQVGGAAIDPGRGLESFGDDPPAAGMIQT